MSNTPRFWFVLVANQQKGPYDEETLASWLRSGQISPETQAWREGLANWIPLAQALGPLPSATSSSPIPSVPADVAFCPHCGGEIKAAAKFCKHCKQSIGTAVAQPVIDAAPRKSKKLFVLIGAGVVLLLILAGLAYYFLFFSKENNTLEDVLAENLPSGTDTVALRNLDLNDPSLSSLLAKELCGGTNVDLMLQIAQVSPNMVRDQLLSLKEDEARIGLECGEAARAALNSPLIIEVSFKHDNTTSSVQMIDTGFAKLPMLSHVFSGFQGYCTHKEDDDGECDDNLMSAFREGTRWVIGKFVDVDSFARSRASSQNFDSTNVDILRKIAAKARIEEHTYIQSRPDTVPWMVVCQERAPSGDAEKEFNEACFPANQDRVFEAINTKVRAIATAFREPDPDKNETLYSRSFSLLARDSDASDSLMRDVEDLVRDWKSQISNNESSLIRIVRDSAGKNSVEAAIIEPFIRALLQAKVEIDGDVVSVAFETEFTKEEMGVLKEARYNGSAMKNARTDIVKAILGKSPIPRTSLEKIVGKETADWVLARRATEEDCAALRSRLSTILSNIQLQPEQYGIKFTLEQMFSEGKCPGAILEQKTQDCMIAAPDLDKLNACLPQ